MSTESCLSIYRCTEVADRARGLYSPHAARTASRTLKGSICWGIPMRQDALALSPSCPLQPVASGSEASQQRIRAGLSG
eukprot:5948418-Prymnesium_polylepis.1